jgi:hypothetical protein
MRAGLTSLVLFLISTLSFTSARPRSFASHSDSNDAIARRQYHAPRALLDTCANVDLGILLHHVGDVSTKVCLCLSLFPLDLDLFVDLKSILNILGPNELDARLKLEVCLVPSLLCSSSDSCCRSENLVIDALILYTVNKSVHLTILVTSNVRMVIPRMETSVSARLPTPSVTENAATFLTFVQASSILFSIWLTSFWHSRAVARLSPALFRIKPLSALI